MSISQPATDGPHAGTSPSPSGGGPFGDDINEFLQATTDALRGLKNPPNTGQGWNCHPKKMKALMRAVKRG